MMEQTAVTTWQPIRIDIPPAPAVSIGKAARWAALAFASLVVPVAIAAGLFSSPVSLPAVGVVVPVTLEAPAAVVVDDVAPSSAAPAAAESALPAYFFIDWASECETECPALVAAD